jgi:hypothetical protein
MKDSTVLALVVLVYVVLIVAFYIVTTVKPGRPFLLLSLTEFFGK